MLDSHRFNDRLRSEHHHVGGLARRVHVPTETGARAGVWRRGVRGRNVFTGFPPLLWPPLTPLFVTENRLQKEVKYPFPTRR
jgi:hypothetical protein